MNIYFIRFISIYDWSISILTSSIISLIIIYIRLLSILILIIRIILNSSIIRLIIINNYYLLSFFFILFLLFQLMYLRLYILTPKYSDICLTLFFFSIFYIATHCYKNNSHKKDSSSQSKSQ